MPTDTETEKITISGVTKAAMVPAWLIIMETPQPMITPMMPPAYVKPTSCRSSDGSRGGATDPVAELASPLPRIENGEKAR